MTKQYTIKSKSLNSLNEALEKMALKDDVKIIRSPILEADGNFSSIVSSNSNNFDPSKINSNILVDKQDQDEDVIEKKNSLTAKVLDKIKQSLETSDELQGLLSEIDKLNKDTDYNTWKANEEQNTAYLKSKNAYIFLQNDNICLSHDNQVEIFKSVNELHDWLKKHNYPLPKSIKLHESVLNEEDEKITKTQKHISFLKGTLGKWFDILYPNTATDSQGHKLGDTFKDTRSQEQINKEKSDAMLKPNRFAKMSREQVRDVERLSDLKDLYPWLRKEPEDIVNWPKESVNEDTFDTSNLWYLVYQNPTRDETFYLNDNWEEGNLLSNNLQQASAFLNREEAIDTLKTLYSSKQTQYPFKPIQEKALGECGVTCGSLGPAVQYTAKKEDLQEDDLQEMGRLANGNERYGYGGVRTGTVRNTSRDLLRNATGLNDQDKDNLKRAIDSQSKDTKRQIGSKNLSHKEIKPDFYATYPNMFLQAISKKPGDMRIVDKEKFISGVQELINELPEDLKFDPLDLTSTDEQGNLYYKWALKNPGYDEEEWKKIKPKRDAFANKFYEKYWDPMYKQQRGYAVDLQNLASIEDEEKRNAYAKAVETEMQAKDISRRSKTDEFGNTNLLTAKYPGIRRNFTNASHNKNTEPYFNEFVNNVENDEPAEDLREWLVDNIKYNDKLNQNEKSLLCYGLLEYFTKKKDFNPKNPDDDSYIPDLESNDGYSVVRNFLLKNKIKPLNTIDYLDDKYIQNMAFGESTTISPFKQQFMKYLNNNLQDITLKEDDSPEDFATNIKADMDTTASDVSQNSLNDQGDTDLNLDADSSMGNEDGESGVNFGDININGGAGDYGPEEDEQMQGMPMEPVDEYKIIDVLVNDDNNEDIRVKVQNLTTGEIETKELSEIDI